ncbi:hypothetical protein VPHK137_0060 [Vibrio phage K137]
MFDFRHFQLLIKIVNRVTVYITFCGYSSCN